MLVSSALRAPPRTAEKAKEIIRERAKPRLFHARMVVTRVEEWCVEAASAEEARALLAAGAGHRCTPGENVQVEFERLIDE
jgi:uncharacterized protein YbaP (TraB family)